MPARPFPEGAEPAFFFIKHQKCGLGKNILQASTMLFIFVKTKTLNYYE